MRKLKRKVLKWFAEKATGNRWLEGGALLVRQLPTGQWITQPLMIGGLLEEKNCRKFDMLAGAVAYAEREYRGRIMKVLPEMGATEEAHQISLMKQIESAWTICWKRTDGLEEAKGLFVANELDDALEQAQRLFPGIPLQGKNEPAGKRVIDNL